MIAILFAVLFAVDNKEFFDTVAEQKAQGYKWVEVGKTVPSGTPAITIKPENGNEYIVYRLEK